MAAFFWVGGSGTWDASDTTHWSTSSGGSGGASVPGSSDTATFDDMSGAGTVTVNTNVNIATLITSNFTGTLDFSVNNNSVTLGRFVNTGSNTRTIKCGGGQWTITRNNVIVWQCSDLTNCTFVPPTLPVILNYSGSVGARDIRHGNVGPTGNESNAPSFSITAGSDTITNVGTISIKDFNLTGFSGTLSGNSRMIYGNLTLSATTTNQSGGSITMAATSGTKTITTNGCTLQQVLTIDGVGGTFVLGDTFTSANRITVTNGTFDFNDQNASIDTFASNNSNTRVISLGSGTISLTGTGTLWNVNSTNLTIDAGTSRIVMNDTSSSSKTFAGGTDTTYYDIEFAGAGTGIFIVGVNTGAMTIHDLIVTTPPHTVQFFAGKTITFTGDFDVDGAGINDRTSIESTTAGIQFTLSKASGSVSVDYLDISDSIATGGATWTANGSLDQGNNSGWIFNNPYSDQATAIRDQNHVPVWMGVSALDGVTHTVIAVDSVTGGVEYDDGTSVMPSASITYEKFNRDQNHVPVKGGVSDTNDAVFIPISVNPLTGAVQVIST